MNLEDYILMEETKSDLILIRGIPGSGKTFYIYKSY